MVEGSIIKEAPLTGQGVALVFIPIIRSYAYHHTEHDYTNVYSGADTEGGEGGDTPPSLGRFREICLILNIKKTKSGPPRMKCSGEF